MPLNFNFIKTRMSSTQLTNWVVGMSVCNKQRSDSVNCYCDSWRVYAL